MIFMVDYRSFLYRAKNVFILSTFLSDLVRVEHVFRRWEQNSRKSPNLLQVYLVCRKNNV